MPLHLLGKKSWNVYNADNIARVRRDEAAAKAKEEAEEQRMQEVDAERRLAILRGEEPSPLPPTEETPEDEPRRRDRDAGSFGRERKKRKRAGEDDTDFELRVARERSGVVQTANETLRKSTSSAPIVDAAGHIDLFGDERKQGRHLKNEEAEKEAAKKKKEIEDQYTMRLSNAAGKDGLVGPWYAASGSRAELAELEPAGKDAFGNEDPGRKKRNEQRIVANDPLAMMKMGASRVREVKKERQRFEAERHRELEQLRKEEKLKERHERRRREHRRDKERHPRDRSRGEDDGEARSRSRRDSERYPRSSRDDERPRSRERHHEERSQRHERRDEGDRLSRRDERSRHEGRVETKIERSKRDSDSRQRDDHRRPGEPREPSKF
ncbi:hypothetical protein COL5a_006742 [Colletotrichum fioriniae]|uniref:uncharacterized protein n=1 Tax=Colletotrichum fioriniae TaxID=710243 RepID=UPI0032D9FBC8|nr:hypothetical protein COL5a_006742 [Colletotrichum fioriniae]KAJ3949930.1 hypothetical protein N0V96_001065 [Colletotrichum fioriniae]